MTALPPQLAPGTYVIDDSHSDASFTVRHAGVSKVRGSVSGIAGTITVGEDLESSSASVTLDATTVDTRDANRDGHLKSPDFFDVENSPTWTFTSTAVRGDGDDYVVVGDLTIHGVTRQVELETEFGGAGADAYGNQRVGFAATTEISRKDFGLTWNVALEAGGVLVGDKVKIAVDVEGVKQD